jgi:putative ABC transport system substrate-binding protein
MIRRNFIMLLGGAAAWPLAARAQSERVRRIGLLMGVADDQEGQARLAALKKGLQELGWTDGRNIQIETRFGGADVDRIQAHAAELMALAPDAHRPNDASHPGAATGDKLHSDHYGGGE